MIEVFEAPQLAIIGAVIGAVAGHMLNKAASKSAAKDQAALNDQNYEAQKEFAQHGIRWKVEDAKAAGIHPLYALGSATNPFSASYASSSAPQSDVSQWANLGSNIGRAVAAKQTNMERLQERLLETQIEGQEIDNMARASEVARRTAQLPPALPSLGVGDTSEQFKQQVQLTGDLYNRPMSNPELSEARDNLPSEVARQLLEDVLINPAILTGRYLRNEYDAWRRGDRSFRWK